MFKFLDEITIQLLEQHFHFSEDSIQKAKKEKGTFSLFEYLVKNQNLSAEKAKKILTYLIKQTIPCDLCHNPISIQLKPLKLTCFRCKKTSTEKTIAFEIPFTKLEESLTLANQDQQGLLETAETLADESLQQILQESISPELEQTLPPGEFHYEEPETLDEDGDRSSESTLTATRVGSTANYAKKEAPSSELSISQIMAMREGQKLKIGKYEVIEEVGRGGMGIVYRVFQPDLQQDFALKFLLDGQLGSEEQIERFKNEAKIVASLDHPNIVRIQDLGQQENRWYYCMDYIDGENFGFWFANKPYKDTLPLFLKIAKAITYAHKKSVIHRDIKPDNILVSINLEPKVLDFGLAKNQASKKNLTNTNAIMGTPNYISPEQAQGKRKIDGRTDVFSMGVILYQILTHRLPFEETTQMATMLAIIGRDPISPRKLNPKIPKDLETVCLKALEKSPEKRYQMAELADEIERFLQGEPIKAKSISPVGRLLKKAQKYRKTSISLIIGLTGIFLLSLLLVQERMKLDKMKSREEFNILLIEAKTKESRGETKEALKLLNKAIKQSKNSEEALLLRGQFYQKSKDYLEASADFYSLLNSQKYRDKALYGLAECSLATENPAKSIEYLRNIQKKTILPAWNKTWYQACLAYATEMESVGLIEESQHILKEAIEKNTTKPTTEVEKEKENIQRKLESYQSLLNPKTKKEQLSRFRFLDKTPFLRKKLGKELDSFLQAEPNNGEARTIRAGLLLDLSRYQEAERDYFWLTQRFPENPDYWQKLSFCQKNLSKNKKADFSAQKAAQRYIQLGQIALSNTESKLQESEKAVSHFRKAILLAPEQIPLKLSLSKALYIYGLWFGEEEFQLEKSLELLQEAKELLNKSLSQFPENLIKQANQLNRKINSTITNYQAAFHPKKPRDYGIRATLHYRKFKDPLKAIQLYTQALQLAPNQELLLNNRAGMYISLGLMEKAIQDLKKALIVNPNFPEAAQQLYSIYKKQNNLKEMEKWKAHAIKLLFRQAKKQIETKGDLSYLNLVIEASERAPFYVKIRIKYYLSENIPSRSMPDLLYLHQLYPQDEEVWFFLGKAFYQMRLFPAAKAYLNQVLQKKPLHQEALNLIKQIK